MTSDGSVSIEELVKRLRAYDSCNRHSHDHYCPNCDRSIHGDLFTDAANALATLQQALEPFARAAECLDAYDPGFPDDAAILRASADVYVRFHGRPNAETVGELNKPLVAGDLRRAAAALKALPPQQDAAEVSSQEAVYVWEIAQALQPKQVSE